MDLTSLTPNASTGSSSEEKSTMTDELDQDIPRQNKSRTYNKNTSLDINDQLNISTGTLDDTVPPMSLSMLDESSSAAKVMDANENTLQHTDMHPFLSDSTISILRSLSNNSLLTDRLNKSRTSTQRYSYSPEKLPSYRRKYYPEHTSYLHSSAYHLGPISSLSRGSYMPTSSSYHSGFSSSRVGPLHRLSLFPGSDHLIGEVAFQLECRIFTYIFHKARYANSCTDDQLYLMIEREARNSFTGLNLY